MLIELQYSIAKSYTSAVGDTVVCGHYHGGVSIPVITTVGFRKIFDNRRTFRKIKDAYRNSQVMQFDVNSYFSSTSAVKVRCRSSSRKVFYYTAQCATFVADDLNRDCV